MTHSLLIGFLKSIRNYFLTYWYLFSNIVDLNPFGKPFKNSFLKFSHFDHWYCSVWSISHHCVFMELYTNLKNQKTTTNKRNQQRDYPQNFLCEMKVTVDNVRKSVNRWFLKINLYVFHCRGETKLKLFSSSMKIVYIKRNTIRFKHARLVKP